MAQTTKWVAGFRAAVMSPEEPIRFSEPRGFADQTVRQILPLAGGGEQIRILLTNRYGSRPLVIGAARVAVRKTGGAIVPETDAEIRFGGAGGVSIPPGGELTSDPVDLAVDADTELALSLHLPGETGPATYSHISRSTAFIAEGDATAAADLPDAEQVESRFYVTGVDVLAPAGTQVAVAFGDSWFEGVGTTVDANRRSVDALNDRLDDAAGHRRGWVVNQGISGNRLLTDGIGPNALRRFEQDVLTVPGVTHVLVNLGINDLGLPGLMGLPPATADEMIAGFEELAGKIRAAGLRSLVATIGPFAGAVYPGLSSPEGLANRQRVNEWIRGSAAFDAVFDVARAVADPERPDFIRPDLDEGDGMHLNDAGAYAMAGAVDLADLQLGQ